MLTTLIYYVKLRSIMATTLPAPELPHQQPDLNALQHQERQAGRHRVLAGTLAADGTIILGQEAQDSLVSGASGGRHRASDGGGSEAWRAWQAEDPGFHAGLEGRAITTESDQLRARHAVDQPADGRGFAPMTAAEFFSPAKTSGDVLTKTGMARRLIQSAGFGELPGAVKDKIVNSAFHTSRVVTAEEAAANAEHVVRQGHEADVAANASQFAFRGYQGGRGTGERVMGEHGADQIANRNKASDGGLTAAGLPSRRK